MKVTQLHLALTHIPVVLSLAALVLLAIAMIRKNDTLTKTALYFFIVAAIFAIPVYLTGEPASEIIAKQPGVATLRIEDHESTAEIGFAILLFAGLFSAAGLIFYKQATPRLLRTGMVTVGFIAALVMLETAQTGGLIRHSEANISPKPKPPEDKTLQQLREESENETHEVLK